MRRIRAVRPADNDAVYDICLRTADSGEDATHLYDDPALPGHVWAGPYVAHEADFGFVLVDDSDTPIGYVLGALDSIDLADRLERSWWPPLRVRYPLEVDRPSAADRMAVRLIHRRSRPDLDLVDRYPSHLHIDLLPSAQGHGAGRRMIEHLVEALTAAGSSGVHLGVSPHNERAIAFYRAIGFTALVDDDHHVVFGLVLG